MLSVIDEPLRLPAPVTAITPASVTAAVVSTVSAPPIVTVPSAMALVVPVTEALPLPTVERLNEPDGPLNWLSPVSVMLAVLESVANVDEPPTVKGVPSVMLPLELIARLPEILSPSGIWIALPLVNVTSSSWLPAPTIGPKVTRPLSALLAPSRMMSEPLAAVNVAPPVPIEIAVPAACVMLPARTVTASVLAWVVAWLMAPRIKPSESTIWMALAPLLRRLTGPVKSLAELVSVITAPPVSKVAAPAPAA